MVATTFIRANLIVAGIAGVALATGVWRHREPPTVDVVELFAMAAKDDPKVGSELPAALRDAVPAGDAWVVYLPECTGCNKDPLPSTLPAGLRSAIFVKRTAADAPTKSKDGALVVDRDGSVQRALNAFGGPRVFRYSDRRLRDLQTLKENWRDFPGRSGG